MVRRGFLPLRYIRYLARFKLTPYGRIIIALMFFSAIGSITVEVPFYQLFCALFFLPAVTELIGTLLRPRLSVRCQIPSRATVGVPVQGTVLFVNQGYWPAFDLMVGLLTRDSSIQHTNADRVLASLRTGGEGEIGVDLMPTRRGQFTLGAVHVHSTFPLNLMRFGGGQALPAMLTVIPAYESLDHFDVPWGNTGSPRHPAPLHGAKGESPEYVGSREYVLGESAVRLDIRAWARLGRPVVREYQDEYSFRVALILDTWQSAQRQWTFPLRRGENSGPQLEAAVALTAAIAESLHHREIVIDLFAPGPELYLFQTPQTQARFDTILELLSKVETAKQDPVPLMLAPLQESMESMASAVLVLLDWDESRRHLVTTIRETGRGVRVLLVRSAPTTIPLPPESDHILSIEPELILSGEVRSL